MEAKNKRLKIGVFGGARGYTMIQVLFSHDKADLVAVCDKYEPLLDKVKEKAKELGTEVACYNNFEDFLNHPELDAVVLANYATEHVPFAIRCMKAGKHVLSEVLPCETMAEAVELIEAVEETGMVYAYAENYCYMQHSFEMWQRYQSGEMGEAHYGEGEYIHDCSSIWPRCTYGDRNHWRNRLYATFYCTHSLGPLIAMTGLRPKSVVGFETNPIKGGLLAKGTAGLAGIEMVTMENGAVFKSIHGGLKREPGSINYQLYCDKGVMESGRHFSRHPERSVGNCLYVYKEGEELCKGDWEKYDPDCQIARDGRLKSGIESHAGSDFYPTHCFIEKILGGEDGKWSIDVYQAVDMGICGILAWRSVLNGNTPMAVPNLRNQEERDAWRNDRACTTPEKAGDELLPISSHEELLVDPGDEVYEEIRRLWLAGEKQK
ncbi:MAG: Gfo/Idh/MocA family oxidoreductase [Clostridia bacterium]|nr:Gfo/Idh/MocA family oxidoreductase [Clostridia bacterium]